MSSKRMMRQAIRVGAPALAVVIVVALAAAPVSVAGGNPGKWCADVIKANTEAGLMKNKHYVNPVTVTGAEDIKVIEIALASRSKFVAETPAAIKKATADELTWFANLKANGYKLSTTPMSPYSPAEAKQLIAYQHAHCGITGP